MSHVTFRDENFELRKFVFDADIDVLRILFNQAVSMGPRQREKELKDVVGLHLNMHLPFSVSIDPSCPLLQ